MNEERVKEKYMEFQQLQQQHDALVQYLEELEEKVGEYKQTQKDIDELKKVDKGTEILVPLASGIFFKAKVEDAQNFTVNVGSNTSAKKDTNEVKEILKKQIGEIEETKTQMSREITKINEKITSLYQEVEELSG